MEDARATKESQAFEAIQTADNDEQSFYALCDYFDVIRDDYDLVRSVEKLFKNRGNNLILSAGEALFELTKENKQTPFKIWSGICTSFLSGRDQSLIFFTKAGAPLSVARNIHSHLFTSHKILNKSKTEIIIDRNGISLGSDTSRRYAISGRRRRLVSLLAQSDRPIKMKECAISLGVSPVEAFKIGGDKGSINNNFKDKLGVKDDLINLVSGGYSLNHDKFEISLTQA